MIVSKNV